MSRPFFRGFAAVLTLAFAAAPASIGPASAKTKPKEAKPAAKAEQSGAASADTTNPGNPRNWRVTATGGMFLAQGENSKTCYALATPKDRSPAGLKRDPAYFHRQPAC